MDAQRNRERILEVAKKAFTRYGADASLDDIARQAGVGAGTLYRHFPTRDALIEAVYRSEVEKLAAAARTFAEKMPPIEALRAWMLLFVDHIAAKQIIAPALNSVVGGRHKALRGFSRPGTGSHRIAGEARDQKRRHPQRFRSIRFAASAYRRRACRLRSRLEAERQKAGGYSHRGLPDAGQIAVIEVDKTHLPQVVACRARASTEKRA